MKPEKIKEAKAEAKRFIDKISDLEQAMKGCEYTSLFPKEHGALRRASMDLTRALADMRKP